MPHLTRCAINPSLGLGYLRYQAPVFFGTWFWLGFFNQVSHQLCRCLFPYHMRRVIVVTPHL